MSKKVSLVLSGGGARGIAHIGAIEVLEEQGYEISSLAGTSMGALVGGVYALGKMSEFRDWMCTLDQFKVFNLVDFTFSSQGIVKGDKVLNAMKAFIADSNIEDLPIPYAAVATDILNKKEVVFTEGSVYDAIRASIAIPTVLTPVQSDQTLLVDGGVINNIPLSHVQRSDDDILIAVNVNANIPHEKPTLAPKESEKQESEYQKKIREFYAELQKINPFHSNEKKSKQDKKEKKKKKEEKSSMGYFDLINNTMEVMIGYRDMYWLSQYPPDVLIEISEASCGTFDFYRAEELVAVGRQATEKKLASLEKA